MLFNKKTFFIQPENNGQVSTETLVAVVIIFLLFVVILAYNSMVSDSSTIVADSIKNKSNCLKLSQIISSVYSNGEGTSTTFQSDFNAQIFGSKRTIQIGDEFCSFLANTTDKSIGPNDYTLTNVDWNIIIS